MARLADQAQLAHHNDGTTRPDTAIDPALVAVHDPTFPDAVLHLDGVGMRVAREAVQAAKAARSNRGRPPKECLAIVFAGPPAYDTPECWGPLRERFWYEATRDAERELLGPHSLIVTSDAHRDETSPHTQSLVVPFDSEGRLGWCHVRDEACKRLRPVVADLRAKAQVELDQRRAAGEELPDLPQPSTKSRYGILQDFVYYRVSRPFGLERGEVGSQAKHQEIDRQNASERAAKRARAEAERLQAETATLETRSSQLVSDIDKLTPQVAELRRTRDDEEALAARWAVGKGAVRTAKIRDGYAGQVRAAQALAREETRRRQVAEGSLGTVTDDARTAAERAAAVFKTEHDARMRAEKQVTDDARTAAELAAAVFKTERDARLRVEKQVTDDARTAAERAAAVFKTEHDARIRVEKKLTDESDRLVKRDAELVVAEANITRLGGLLAHAQDQVRTLKAQLDQAVKRRAAAVARVFRSGFVHAQSVLDSHGATPASQVGQILVSALRQLDSSPDARDRGEPGPGPGPVRDRD